MMLSRIAEQLDTTAQLANYHLSKLQDEGLLTSELRDRKRYYKVQDAFTEINVEKIDEFLSPLVDMIAEKVEVGQAKCDEAHALSNVVAENLRRYVAYLEIVFKNNNCANALIEQSNT